MDLPFLLSFSSSILSLFDLRNPARENAGDECARLLPFKWLTRPLRPPSTGLDAFEKSGDFRSVLRCLLKRCMVLFIVFTSSSGLQRIATSKRDQENGRLHCVIFLPMNTQANTVSLLIERLNEWHSALSKRVSLIHTVSYRGYAHQH